MANQESHFDKVKNAFTDFMLILVKFHRRSEWGQARINLNNKLIALGYHDTEGIINEFTSRFRNPPRPPWPPGHFNDLSRRLNINFDDVIIYLWAKVKEYTSSREFRESSRIYSITRQAGLDSGMTQEDSEAAGALAASWAVARGIGGGGLFSSLRDRLLFGGGGGGGRKNRKTRVRSRKMRKTRKISSR